MLSVLPRHVAMEMKADIVKNLRAPERENARENAASTRKRSAHAKTHRKSARAIRPARGTRAYARVNFFQPAKQSNGEPKN